MGTTGWWDITGNRMTAKRRSCIVPFIDQHERLCALLDDPRIKEILVGLLDENFNYMGSDGNYYAGDTQWHSDGWGKEIRFVKIALYLDHLTRDTGCLRVIPGSHHLKDQYANNVENTVRNSPDQWGIHGPDVPALPLETNPGDVVLFNHNLKHAAFGGSPRRRMFTINCSERFPEDEEHIDLLKNTNCRTRAVLERSRLWKNHARKPLDPNAKNIWKQVIAHDDHLAELSARAREEMPETIAWITRTLLKNPQSPVISNRGAFFYLGIRAFESHIYSGWKNKRSAVSSQWSAKNLLDRGSKSCRDDRPSPGTATVYPES